ncbi:MULTISPECIES: hypothetical protein [Gordonibacter]|uniref:Uncharacterized protein n=1 Tax=Gordonibacter faecis TaxID=3047475 RepID=A0ABT7DNH8_9ACTN|nr:MULTISPECIES: hypothetical protein [unclassified Gordonibacter]MDJ1651100.1 hypothetical protein [Gordonibacter sp. KGMB12511]
MDEDTQTAIEETLFLNGIPGMGESLQAEAAEKLEDCLTEDQLEW